MKRILKFFLILILVGGIVYFFYHSYIGGKAKEDLEKKMKVYGEKSKSFVTEKGGELFSKVNELIKENSKKIAGYAGEKMIMWGENLAKQSISSSSNMILQETSNNSNVAIQADSSVPNLALPSSLFLLVKANTDFGFVLSPSLNYKVDWGDGMVSSGKSKENEPTVVFHKWSEGGNYTVTVELVNDSQVKTSYSFSVRVLK